jgi:biotin synthase
MIDPEITALVDRAVADERLTRSEARRLFDLDEYSPEAYYLHWGAHQIAWKATNGEARIYAQIGVDARPCPENCAFCSFATSFAAASGTGKRNEELPLEEVVHYAAAFDAAGTHLISLMTTAAYPFERFLELAAAVRAVIRPETLLMSNIGDFNLEQAVALKEAGIDVAYHAIRLGEGRITAIPEQRRRDTIAAIQKAGLLLMSGVEPVHAELDDDELLDRLYEIASWPLICSGPSRLRPVTGTPMENTRLLSEPRYRQIMSLFRLLAGTRIPYGSENHLWVNGGTNPRDTRMFPGKEAITTDVAACRAELEANGWRVV